MMLSKLIFSFIAVVRCDAFTFSPSISQRHAATRPHETAPLFSQYSGSDEHFVDRVRPSASATIQHASEIWELGLVINSKASIPLEHACRCINQVVGISEAESLEVVTQAYRHGIASLTSYPLM